MLARLLGLRVVTVRQSGRRDDAAHRIGLASRRRRVGAPAPRPRTDRRRRRRPLGVHRRVQPLRRRTLAPVPRRPRAAVGWCCSSSAPAAPSFDADAWRAPRAPAGWRIIIAGTPRSRGRTAAIALVGHVEPCAGLLAAADVVVTSAGWAAVADAVAAGARLVVVPEDRPFDEQVVRVRRARRRRPRRRPATGGRTRRSFAPCSQRAERLRARRLGRVLRRPRRRAAAAMIDELHAAMTIAVVITGRRPPATWRDCSTGWPTSAGAPDDVVVVDMGPARPAPDCTAGAPVSARAARRRASGCPAARRGPQPRRGAHGLRAPRLPRRRLHPAPRPRRAYDDGARDRDRDALACGPRALPPPGLARRLPGDRVDRRLRAASATRRARRRPATLTRRRRPRAVLVAQLRRDGVDVAAPRRVRRRLPRLRRRGHRPRAPCPGGRIPPGVVRRRRRLPPVAPTDAGSTRPGSARSSPTPAASDTRWGRWPMAGWLTELHAARRGPLRPRRRRARRPW